MQAEFPLEQLAGGFDIAVLNLPHRLLFRRFHVILREQHGCRQKQSGFGTLPRKAHSPNIIKRRREVSASSKFAGY
jgi:hypothetical protein